MITIFRAYNKLILFNIKIRIVSFKYLQKIKIKKSTIMIVI